MHVEIKTTKHFFIFRPDSKFLLFLRVIFKSIQFKLTEITVIERQGKIVPSLRAVRSQTRVPSRYFSSLNTQLLLLGKQFIKINTTRRQMNFIYLHIFTLRRVQVVLFRIANTTFFPTRFPVSKSLWPSPLHRVRRSRTRVALVLIRRQGVVRYRISDRASRRRVGFNYRRDRTTGREHDIFSFKAQILTERSPAEYTRPSRTFWETKTCFSISP